MAPKRRSWIYTGDPLIPRAMPPERSITSPLTFTMIRLLKGGLWGTRPSTSTSKVSMVFPEMTVFAVPRKPGLTSSGGNSSTARTWPETPKMITSMAIPYHNGSFRMKPPLRYPLLRTWNNHYGITYCPLFPVGGQVQNQVAHCHGCGTSSI